MKGNFWEGTPDKNTPPVDLRNVPAMDMSLHEALAALRSSSLLREAGYILQKIYCE